MQKTVESFLTGFAKRLFPVLTAEKNKLPVVDNCENGCYITIEQKFHKNDFQRT